MTKKICALVLALAMAFGLVACSSTTPSTSAPVPSSSADTSIDEAVDFSNVSFTFASDAVGSSGYNITVEMSKVLEEEIGIGNIDVSPISPGGMGAPYLFEDGTNVSMSFIPAAPAKWAREDGTLGKSPVSGYSAITSGLNTVGAVTCVRNAFLEKYGISTIEEAIEQKLPLRIGCSPVGSMDAQVVLLLLEALGTSQEELESWGGSLTHGSGAENQELISDGQIDMYLDHTSHNSSTMAEIAMTQDVTFVQWNQDTLDWFLDKGFQMTYIPAGSFRGQEEKITMPGSPDAIFCRNDMDENLVYAITKALCENRDALAEVYSSLEPWDVELGCTPERLGSNPLHPGAERYYREVGYIK